MDYHTFPRRQLQTLCKKHGIPANSTNKDMAEALSALFKANPQLQTEKKTIEEDTVTCETTDHVTTPARRTPRNTRRRDSVIPSKSKDSSNDDAISDLTHELGDQIKMKDLSSCADSEVDSSSLTPAKIQTPKSATRSSQRTTRAKASAPCSVSKSVAARLEQAQEASDANEVSSEQKALRACLIDTKVDQPRKKKGAVTFSDVVEFKEVEPPVEETPASARKSRTTRNIVKEQVPESVSTTRSTTRKSATSSTSQRRSRDAAEVDKDIETPQKSGTWKANETEQVGSARRTPTRGKLQQSFDIQEGDNSTLSVPEMGRRTRRSATASFSNNESSREDQNTTVKRSTRRKSAIDAQELTKLSVSEERELDAAVGKASTRRPTRSRGSRNDAVSPSSKASQDHEINETDDNVKTSSIDSAEDHDLDVTVLGSEDKSDFEYVHLQCLNMVDETDSDKENALHLSPIVNTEELKDAIADVSLPSESNSMPLEHNDAPEENNNTDDVNIEVVDKAEGDTEVSIAVPSEQNISSTEDVLEASAKNGGVQTDSRPFEEEIPDGNKNGALPSTDEKSLYQSNAEVDVVEFPANVNSPETTCANETELCRNVGQTSLNLDKASMYGPSSGNEAVPVEIVDQEQMPCDNRFDTMGILIVEGAKPVNQFEEKADLEFCSFTSSASKDPSAITTETEAVSVQNNSNAEQNDLYVDTHNLQETKLDASSIRSVDVVTENQGHEIVEKAQDNLTTNRTDDEAKQGDILNDCPLEVQDQPLETESNIDNQTSSYDPKVCVLLQTSPDASMKVNVEMLLPCYDTISPSVEDEFALKLCEIGNLKFKNAEISRTEMSAPSVTVDDLISSEQESFSPVTEAIDNVNNSVNAENASETTQIGILAASTVVDDVPTVEHAADSSVTPVEVIGNNDESAETVCVQNEVSIQSVSGDDLLVCESTKPVIENVQPLKSDGSAASDDVPGLMDISENADVSQNPAHAAPQMNQIKGVDLQTLSLRKLKELCKVKSKSGKTTNDNSGNDISDVAKKTPQSPFKPAIKTMVSSQQMDSPTAAKRSALKTLPSNIKQSTVIVNQHELAIVKSPTSTTKSVLSKDSRFNTSSPISFSSRRESSMNIRPR